MKYTKYYDTEMRGDTRHDGVRWIQFDSQSGDDGEVDSFLSY